MDMIGPLPTTKLGNNWIVTWVDRITKTIVAAAAAAPTSKETLRLTFREICCRFGLPLNLTMDNDVQFNNGLWKSLWKMCGSKLTFTSSYHSQADPIERICNARCHKGVDELCVEWQGYDQSQNGWVARSFLLQDVPHLVHAFEANPLVFKSPKSAPKRASTAVRDSVLPPPPPALPVVPLHPRQV